MNANKPPTDIEMQIWFKRSEESAQPGTEELFSLPSGAGPVSSSMIQSDEEKLLSSSSTPNLIPTRRSRDIFCTISNIVGWCLFVGICIAFITHVSYDSQSPESKTQTPNLQTSSTAQAYTEPLGSTESLGYTENSFPMNNETIKNMEDTLTSVCHITVHEAQRFVSMLKGFGWNIVAKVVDAPRNISSNAAVEEVHRAVLCYKTTNEFNRQLKAWHNTEAHDSHEAVVANEHFIASILGPLKSRAESSLRHMYGDLCDNVFSSVVRSQLSGNGSIPVEGIIPELEGIISAEDCGAFSAFDYDHQGRRYHAVKQKCSSSVTKKIITDDNREVLDIDDLYRLFFPHGAEQSLCEKFKTVAKSLHQAVQNGTLGQTIKNHIASSPENMKLVLAVANAMLNQIIYASLYYFHEGRCSRDVRTVFKQEIKRTCREVAGMVQEISQDPGLLSEVSLTRASTDLSTVVVGCSSEDIAPSRDLWHCIYGGR